jgi:choline-sulfatase
MKISQKITGYAVLAGGLLYSGNGCHAGDASQSIGKSLAGQPNILIIMTDQQSADAMSHVIGDRYLNTPNMDYLAQHGISFTKAYCANPLSMPSRTSMLTGRYPHETGIQTNSNRRIDPAEFPCMGTVFARNGYETGYIGKWHIPYNAQDKETHGFQYMRHLKDKGVDSLIPTAAIDFIKEERQKPFLAVVSFCNPHNICEWARGDKLPDGNIGIPISPDECPPLLPNHEPAQNETDIMKDMRSSFQANPKFPVADFDERKWREYRWAYYRMIEKVDNEIGKILDVLKKSGKDKNTLLVFLSDHGDMQGAHLWNQKTVFYEEASRVPLIICLPGLTAPVQSDILIQTGIDLLPTLCAYANIEPPVNLPGRNILEMMDENSKNLLSSRDYIVVSNKMIEGKNIFSDRESFTPEGRMIRSSKYKYWIYDVGEQRESLFDIENDPSEINDLASNSLYRNVLNEHRQYMKEWAIQYGDRDSFINSKIKIL